MIQAILADDEGIIVKGLKKLIDWERLGVEKTAAITELNVGEFWEKVTSLQAAVQAEAAQ